MLPADSLGSANGKPRGQVKTRFFREAAIAQNESMRFFDSAMTIRGANPGLRLFVTQALYKKQSDAFAGRT